MCWVGNGNARFSTTRIASASCANILFAGRYVSFGHSAGWKDVVPDNACFLSQPSSQALLIPRRVWLALACLPSPALAESRPVASASRELLLGHVRKTRHYPACCRFVLAMCLVDLFQKGFGRGAPRAVIFLGTCSMHRTS